MKGCDWSDGEIGLGCQSSSGGLVYTLSGIIFDSKVEHIRTGKCRRHRGDKGRGMQRVSSWGRLGLVPHEIRRPAFLDEAQNAVQSPGPMRLCFGLGRSYGDVCLNANGRLIITDTLDRIISFDRERGLL